VVQPIRQEDEIQAEIAAVQKEQGRFPTDARSAIWTLLWVLGRGPAVSETLRRTGEAMERLRRERG